MTSSTQLGVSSTLASSNQCEWCGRISREKLKKCGKCRIPRYCNQRCQTVHWPEHKLVCLSPKTSTIDVTKSVVNKTLLNNAQVEQTTGPFNHLNNTVTLPPAPIAEVKKTESPTSSKGDKITPYFECDGEAQSCSFVAEWSHLQTAIGLLSVGNIPLACKYILARTTLTGVRIAFLRALAKSMCHTNKANLSKVMELAPRFVELGWRENVIEALCEAKIFASPEAIEQALQHNSSASQKKQRRSSS